MTRSMTSSVLGLPKSKMKHDSKWTESSKIEDHNPHILVTKHFEKLWHAKDVDEFKRVFLDCLECHYHTWNTERLLHRELCENNLMIFRPSESTEGVLPITDATPLSRGILIDFDVELGHPHYRTAKIPFMALELLKKDCPSAEHFYRYDLESFYYLLIWAAIHYDLGSGKPNRRNTPLGCPLSKWSNPEGDVAHDAKFGLVLDDLVHYISPGWKDVWAKWIMPLYDLFEEGHIKMKRIKKAMKNAMFVGDGVSDDVKHFDYKTCDGLLTFQKFMDTIGVTPRRLEHKDTLSTS